MFIDQLKHVFVGGDDHDVAASVGGLAGESADYVVGFEAGVLDQGEAEGLDEPLDVRNLSDQVGRCFGAVGFVFGVFLFAMGSLPRLSKMATMYCGSKVFASLRSML